MQPDHSLEKSLTLGPAIGLAITMVVGSGLLVLPGLAYAQVGSAAIYIWLISAIAVGPILIIFSTLGAKFPNAGGVAGFLRAAFGEQAGIATELLVLGAVPGGAAVAITGGQYFATMVDGSPLALILGTACVLILGGVVITLTSFVFGNRSGGLAPLEAWPQALPAFGLVFFAFVGWEMMAFTSEEFKNPKRDFPLMMAISYGIVVILYALIALATQFMFQQNDPVLSQAPMAAMLSNVLGPFSGKLVAGIGFVLVLANFISVVWAFSRLTFSSAREGLLPEALAQLEPNRAVPVRAIVVVTCAFGLFVLAYLLNWISHSLLFELAGVSFFFSYLLAVAAYLKIARSFTQKALGVLAFCLTLGLFFTFGQKALYAIALFGIGLAAGRRKK
jgi:amino acid efflux transporter